MFSSLFLRMYFFFRGRVCQFFSSFCTAYSVQGVYVSFFPFVSPRACKFFCISLLFEFCSPGRV